MDSTKPPRWIWIVILIGSGLFVFALILSAVFDPGIRLLHALQALIYVAVIVLARRNSSWGFGAGAIIATFWNYINLFVTTFIKSGAQQLWLSLQSGHLQRPDLVLALAAGLGHFLLIIACVAGFLRSRPDLRRWGQFLAGGVLSVAYFILIIVTTGPQYIPLLKRTFHM